MEYEFNVWWMLGGLAITVAGGLIVVFYKQISDGLINGVSSYEKTKLFGVITAIVGMLLASNLLPAIMVGIARLIFQK